MASKCSRMFSRCSMSTLKSAISRPNPSSIARPPTTSYTKPSLPSNPLPSTLRPASLSRPPAVLGALASMLPLHSAVATARMTSCLSSSSRSCRALSQDDIDGT